MCHIKNYIVHKGPPNSTGKNPTGIHHVNRFFNWLQFLFGFQLQHVEQETNKPTRCRIQELGARLDQWLTRSGGFAGGSGSLLTSHWTRALANNTVCCLIYVGFPF